MDQRATHPIGIFDSGIGGLTVASAITRLLPNEDFIYFGDTEHLPYGEKSPEAIQHFAVRISDFLMEQQCKAIVVACNSASSAAYDTLTQHIGNRSILLNVIEPVVSHVLEINTFAKIGIIGTERTIASGSYQDKIEAQVPDLDVRSLPTPLLAPMIEAGFFNNTVSQQVIDKYLNEPRLKDIEALILACTHYPLVKKEIDAFYKGKVKIFDSPNIVAQALKRKLTEQHLLQSSNTPVHQFYVSDYTDSFEHTTKIFYGEQIHLERYPIWAS